MAAVTYESVVEVAEMLAAKGDKVTGEAIRLVFGERESTPGKPFGSPNEVYRHLKAWKAKRREAADQEAKKASADAGAAGAKDKGKKPAEDVQNMEALPEISRIIDALSFAILGSVNAAREAESKRADDLIRKMDEATNARITSMEETVNARIEALEKAHGDRVAELQQEADDEAEAHGHTQERLEALEKAMDDFKTSVQEDADRRLEVARAALEEGFDQRVTDATAPLEAEIVRLTELLGKAQTAQAVAEARVNDLSTQLTAKADEVKAKEAELKALRKEHGEELAAVRKDAGEAAKAAAAAQATVESLKTALKTEQDTVTTLTSQLEAKAAENGALRAMLTARAIKNGADANGVQADIEQAIAATGTVTEGAHGASAS